MKISPHFKRLCSETHGGALVEFGLLAPALIAMLLGVLQIGLQMQNYNAVRSIASEVARYTSVQYQKDNTVDEDAIEEVAIAQAVNAPYFLEGDRIRVAAVPAATSRVTGATEITLTVTYDSPNLLGFIDIDAMNLSYSRPIFVVG